MYEKTTWENGDIITAEKLNNIENGIALTNTENFSPVLKINGDFAVGDTIYGWDEVHDYVYSNYGSAMLVLTTFDPQAIYVYLITEGLGNICLNDDGYAPNINISIDGTISAS